MEFRGECTRPRQAQWSGAGRAKTLLRRNNPGDLAQINMARGVSLCDCKRVGWQALTLLFIMLALLSSTA